MGHNIVKVFLLVAISGILWLLYMVLSVKIDGTDSYIKKAQLDISDIKKAIINERQKRIFSSSDTRWINSLSKNRRVLFDGNDSTHKLLSIGILSGKKYGQWETTDTKAPYKNYIFHLDSNLEVIFKYNDKNGTFDCLPYNKKDSGKICKKLLKL